ncbi:MAG: hypothetical protein ACYS9Y_12345 [Planctomycetota bacterium]|jgi:hypothetical protein
MAEHNEGLQKRVSSIFSGVPIPKSSGTLQIPQQPASENTGNEPAKPAYTHPESHNSPCAAVPAPQNQTDMPSELKPLPNIQPSNYDINKNQIQIRLQNIWETIKDRLLAPKPGVSTSRQITTVVMIPVLFIIMIVVFTKLFYKPSTKKTEPAASQPISVAVASDNKTDWQIPKPYPTGLRDPMQFGSSAAADTGTSGPIDLKGIAYSEDSPFAIIGSQIVKEGDKIFDATIIKINRDSVEFEINGARKILKVQR